MVSMTEPWDIGYKMKKTYMKVSLMSPKKYSGDMMKMPRLGLCGKEAD